MSGRRLVCVGTDIGTQGPSHVGGWEAAQPTVDGDVDLGLIDPTPRRTRFSLTWGRESSGGLGGGNSAPQKEGW